MLNYCRKFEDVNFNICDQNNSYEITINGFQVRNINEIRNVLGMLGSYF